MSREPGWRTLIHLIPTNTWGSSGRHALDICRWARDHGWRVRAVTRGCRAVDLMFSRAGIPLRNAPLRDYPDLFSAPVLASMLRVIPPEGGIVHTHRYRDVLTVLMARHIAHRPDIRIVTSRHSMSPPRDSWLARMAYRSVDCHIFPSRLARDIFYSGLRDATLRPDAYAVVAPGSLYMPDILPEPEPVAGPVVAQYRGQIGPGCGLRALIAAVARLSDLKFRLRIAGSGNPDYIDSLRAEARILRISDRLDWQRGEDFTSPFPAQFHFGISPAPQADLQGMVNIGYMAAGRAQAAFMTGARPEFLRDGVNMLRLDSASPDSLAAALRTLATDAALRRRLAGQALADYEAAFAWPHFEAHLRKAYLL